MPPVTHSTIGASGAHRWMKCPGSVRMEADCPDEPSVYAEEGTVAHELSEALLRSWLNKEEHPNYEAQLGRVLVGNLGNEYVVDEEMMQAVRLYCEVVIRRAEEHPEGSLFIERHLDLSWLEEGMYGTGDAVMAEMLGPLYVDDLKYGKGVAVEVEDNEQLKYYGVGSLQQACCDSPKEKLTTEQLCIIEEVHMSIVQPRAHHPDGPVRTLVMDPRDLMEWGYDVLRPAAQATKDPNAPLVPGAHCKWCKAKAKCPALVEHANGIASTVFDVAQAKPQTLTLPPPAALTTEQIIRAMDFAEVLEDWIKGIKSYLYNEAERGVDCGFKLVDGRANRKWRDEKEAVDVLTKFGCPWYSKKLLSPAQAEKELKKLGQDPKLIEHLINITRGKSLARDSDNRPAIVPAAQAFEGV